MEEMILSIRADFNLNEKLSDKLLLVETCCELLDSNQSYELLIESGNSIKAFALDLLNKLKENLMLLYDNVLILLDKFLMNVAATSNRYKDLLLRIPNEILEGIEFDDYDYPNFNKMPNFKVPVKYEFPKSPMEISNNDMKRIINDMIYDESGKIMNRKLPRVLESSYKDDFKKLCLEELEGFPKRRRLNKELLEELIEKSLYVGESNPKATRDKLKADRKDMIAAYDVLRSSIEKDLEIKSDPISGKVQMKFKDANIDLSEGDYRKVNNNIMEVNRFYITMMNLYDVAFTTKLEVHRNKILRYQQLFQDVLNKSNAAKRLARDINLDIRKKVTMKEL